MTNYRVYCLDGAGKVASAGWVEADDDDAAIALVEQRHAGYKCEVWDGKRLVARIDLTGEAYGACTKLHQPLATNIDQDSLTAIAGTSEHADG